MVAIMIVDRNRNPAVSAAGECRILDDESFVRSEVNVTETKSRQELVLYGSTPA